MSKKITHIMPDYTSILVVGSSTTFGAYDEEGFGWVARFNRMLAKSHQNKRFICINAGVSGHTTRDANMNLINNHGLHEPKYVILAIGTNDSLVCEGLKPETALLSRTDSINSYQNIIHYCQQNNLELLIQGPQPVELETVRFKAHDDSIPGHTSFRYDNEALRMQNDDLEALCKRENVSFLRIFEDWQSREGLWTDGLHPNAKGHQLWAEQVYKKFVSLYL